MVGVQRLGQLFAQMEQDAPWLDVFLKDLVGWVWWWPLIILLVGAGLVFTIANRGVQFRAFGHAIQVIRGKYDKAGDTGDISHFKALTSALSATVGLGNIAGVAIAINKGGPGAVFWMWVIGFIGMATKYTECTLSTKFRYEAKDHVAGGPMYTIERGLGPRWTWLAVVFAIFVTVASFGGGNMFQTNQAATLLKANFGLDPALTGAVIAGLVAIVIIGGIKRIGEVTSRLVPLMCGLYVAGALVILVANAGQVPGMLLSIVQDAFSLEPIIGGTLGAVITAGVQRAVFSNEAGLGSAAIAHAAAKTEEPVREGVVASLGPFIDTIVICTMTALVIIITTDPSQYNPEASGTTLGISLTASAFESEIAGFGQYFLPVAVLMFAISTVIAWSYYGEKGTEYLARKFGGERSVRPAIGTYRGLFCIAAFVGAVESLDTVINFSDAMLGMMAAPNLLACLLLTPLVMKLTRDYFQRLKRGEFDLE